MRLLSKDNSFKVSLCVTFTNKFASCCFSSNRLKAPHSLANFILYILFIYILMYIYISFLLPILYVLSLTSMNIWRTCFILSLNSTILPAFFVIIVIVKSSKTLISAYANTKTIVMAKMIHNFYRWKFSGKAFKTVWESEREREATNRERV